MTTMTWLMIAIGVACVVFAIYAVGFFNGYKACLLDKGWLWGTKDRPM